MRILLLILVGIVVLSAADFCSLTVEVVDPKDQKLSDVLLGVHEQNGRQDAGYTKDGIARFCGLGMSNVTITIGADQNCEITMRNISLAWEVPEALKVVYDKRPCRNLPPHDIDHAYGVPNGAVPNGAVPIFHCRTLLRFYDEDGHRIQGVKVNDLSSDQYGRLMRVFRSNENLHPVAAKDGFLPENADLECADEGSISEQIITLRNRPK